MMRSRTGVVALMAALSPFVFLAPSAGAADENKAPVSVSVNGRVLKVEVTRPSPLRVALDAVCERAQASCKLGDGLAKVTVKPGTLTGSWEDVVASLLQDSGFSYASTPSRPDRPAVLIVEASVGAAGPTRRPAGNVPPSGSPAREVVRDLSEVAEQETEPATDREPQPEEPGTTDPAEGNLVTAATAAATPDASFAMTPFTDGKGNPLMARLPSPGSAPPAMAVLPYADEAGNPLTVPITNEPLSLTPFTGPDGQAWPAPVVQPGQKLEYPIPPNVPPSSKPENQ